jgi:hypothetical protein
VTPAHAATAAVAGACLCGAQRYEIAGPFQLMLHCHCSMCRKHHGAAFATFVAASLDGFRWHKGESDTATYASSPQGARAFCRRCGSVAPTLSPQMGLAILPAGNLEGELGIEPQGHVFSASRAPWYEIADTLVQHAAGPPEFGGRAVERPARETSRHGVRGSCLCGDVVFEASPEALSFVHCHCEQCRRGCSAAHGSVLAVPAAAFVWLAGTSGIAAPGAPASACSRPFCRRCGSLLPRVLPEQGRVSVPAGALDQDPGVRPQAHHCVAQKASWSTIADGLPRVAGAAALPR